MNGKINHPLHIVLSLLTGGLWLFVYLYLIIQEASPSPTSPAWPSYAHDPMSDPLWALQQEMTHAERAQAYAWMRANGQAERCYFPE